MNRSLVPFFVMCSVLLSPAPYAHGQQKEVAIVKIDVASLQQEVPPYASGLSYETSLMLPDSHDVRYFRPDNVPLLAMFRTIGVKSLRIGGNSVDEPKIPTPSLQDVKFFFEFARAAGVHVMYSFRLEEPKGSGGAIDTSLSSQGGKMNAEYAMSVAKLIRERYSDTVDCFAIGNEPYFFHPYALYAAKWKSIHDAVQSVYPEARFCGPDQNPDPELDRNLVQQFANPRDRLAMVDVHTYPFGCSYKNPQDRADLSKLVLFDAALSREKMLSTDAYSIYQKIHDSIGSAIGGAPVGYRLSETNSFWFSGLQGASDRYAAALWSVDYMYWWISHWAQGVNFHTGDRTGGDQSLPSRYAAFVSSSSGYEARPLAYGMKLFDLGAKGRLVSTQVEGAKQIRAYSTLDKHVLRVTLLNMSDRNADDRTAVISMLDAKTTGEVRIMTLRAKHNDISADAGQMTLGGSKISTEGNWNGTWEVLRRDPADAPITVSLAPATAAVVEIHLSSGVEQ